MHDHGDEFVDMNVDVATRTGSARATGRALAFAAASGSGAGPLGFAGTAAQRRGLQAAGLAKLAGDEFGSGPRMPMVPGTWDQDAEGPKSPRKQGGGVKTVSNVAVSDRNPQETEEKGIAMSLLDAHIPQLVASQSAFGAKAALMRSTISQAEQEAMSAQAFHR